MNYDHFFLLGISRRITISDGHYGYNYNYPEKNSYYDDHFYEDQYYEDFSLYDSDDHVVYEYE